MNRLENILGELLLQNNCVIIPNFGGFIANTVSAKIDSKTGVILPPWKALNFNRNLINNDGLIIQHLAKKENISYQKAEEIVTLAVRQIKSDLVNGQQIVFTNVGTLFINNAGKITFTQDRFFNLLLSSYGMSEAHFISVQDEVVAPEKVVPPVVTLISPPPLKVERTISPVDETVQEEKVQEDVETIIQHPASVSNDSSKKLWYKMARYGAIATLIPVLFYSFWLPLKTDVLESGVLYLNDFNLFKKTKNVEPKYNLAYSNSSLITDYVDTVGELASIKENLSNQQIETFSYPLNDDTYILVKRNKSEVAPPQLAREMKYKEIESPKTVTQTVISSNSFKNKPYHIIVGCFSDASNANSLINSLKSKGYNAYEVDIKGGLHRISAGNVSSQEETQAIRNQLQAINTSSWVLKK